MPATKFDKPVFPGAKLVSATVTVTNTSGSYSNTFIDERIATSMRAFQLEIEDPSVFDDKISITTSDGSFTIACDEVAGETDVTVGFLKIADDPTAISSTEFTTLNNRIGDLSDLETTDQTSMVNAVNEVVGDVSDNTQAIATLNDNIGNLSFKLFESLSFTFSNSNYSSKDISDITGGTVLASAKVLIGFVPNGGTPVRVIRNAAATNVQTVLDSALTGTITVNILAIN